MRADDGRSDVQPFPGPGGRSQVSTGGGARAQWHRDGKGLFYIDAGNRLMTVPVATNGPKAEPGTPSVLFSLSPRAFYEASTDGQRFLLNEITKNPSPISDHSELEAPTPLVARQNKQLPRAAEPPR